LGCREYLAQYGVQAIQYLSSDYQPTSAQTPETITQLVKSLEPFGLTKAEKLQIVNLAPQNHIELYVVRVVIFSDGIYKSKM
jgi:hypothetical protein